MHSLSQQRFIGKGGGGFCFLFRSSLEQVEAEFQLQYFEVLMQMVRLTFLNVEIGQIFSFKAMSCVGGVRVVYWFKRQFIFSKILSIKWHWEQNLNWLELINDTIAFMIQLYAAVLIAELNSFFKLMIPQHGQLLNWIETTLN